MSYHDGDTVSVTFAPGSASSGLAAVRGGLGVMGWLARRRKQPHSAVDA